jgi:hypothetical protein
MIKHGPEWPGYDPEDIQMEGVLIRSPSERGIFCSVTVSTKGITERIAYVAQTFGGSWRIKFGGDFGPGTGGHELFPGQITVAPAPAPAPPQD